MITLGIDIGGTKTSIGIVDIRNGIILDNKIIPSKKYTNDNKNLEFIVKTSLELIKGKNIFVTYAKIFTIKMFFS